MADVDFELMFQRVTETWEEMRAAREWRGEVDQWRSEVDQWRRETSELLGDTRQMTRGTSRKAEVKP